MVETFSAWSVLRQGDAKFHRPAPGDIPPIGWTRPVLYDSEKEAAKFDRPRQAAGPGRLDFGPAVEAERGEPVEVLVAVMRKPATVAPLEKFSAWAVSSVDFNNGLLHRQVPLDLRTRPIDPQPHFYESRGEAEAGGLWYGGDRAVRVYGVLMPDLEPGAEVAWTAAHNDTVAALLLAEVARLRAEEVRLREVLLRIREATVPAGIDFGDSGVVELCNEGLRSPVLPAAEVAR